MSGHSKWATIKRKKGAADAKRGQVFTRLTREIVLAAREGGVDADSNFRLRLAVERARAQNMPKENIERAIRRGTGQDKEGVAFEQVYYEGYGPHGVALMIECVHGKPQPHRGRNSPSPVTQRWKYGRGGFGRLAVYTPGLFCPSLHKGVNFDDRLYAGSRRRRRRCNPG